VIVACASFVGSNGGAYGNKHLSSQENGGNKHLSSQENDRNKHLSSQENDGNKH